MYLIVIPLVSDPPNPPDQAFWILSLSVLPIYLNATRPKKLLKQGGSFRPPWAKSTTYSQWPFPVMQWLPPWGGSLPQPLRAE